MCLGCLGYLVGKASGYKKPEVLGVLACGTASARPSGLLVGVLLTGRAGTKALGWWRCLGTDFATPFGWNGGRRRGIATLPEAGGHVGVVPVTVS